MPFSITPLLDMPPPEAQEFPNFIQWQADGTDLGLADADTVNVTGGLLATRGTGENANTITLSGEGAPPTQIQFQEDGVDLGGPDADTLNFSTGITATRLGATVTVVVPDPPAPPAPIQWQDEGVDLGSADADTVDFVGAGVTATRAGDKITVTIPGGGGGNSIGVLSLESNPDPSGPIATFNYATISGGDQLFPTVIVASADWDCPSGFLHFINAGIYRIIAHGYIQAENEWPSGNTTFGGYVNDVIGVHARTHTGGDSNDSASRVLFTDQVIINATEDSSMQVGVQALATNNAHGIMFAGITLAIEKIA